MFGPIHFKRAVKRASNWTAVLAHNLIEDVPPPSGAIFYYHRVADLDFIDARVDDHNVAPKVFERQIAALAKVAEIVPLEQLPEKLKNWRRSAAKPLLSLTFDDGYSHFFSNVLPVLKRYDAPATLSVVTAPINQSKPMPFDKWALKNFGKVLFETWKPIKWREIEHCLASGLITLGAHSHEHRRANECTSDEIHEEVGRSAEILFNRFGKENVPVYAYPYGNTFLGHVPPDYEKAVRANGFKLAVTTDFGQVTQDSEVFRLPRIEAHGLDTAAVMRAKLKSKVSPFYLHDYLRAAIFRLGRKREVLRSGF